MRLNQIENQNRDMKLLNLAMNAIMKTITQI